MNETELSPPPASPPAAQGSSWEAFPGVGVGPNNAPAVTAAATHPDRGRLLDHEPEDATPRVHHAARRCGGRVADRGAGAEAGGSGWLSVCRFARGELLVSLQQRAERNGFRRGRQR